MGDGECTWRNKMRLQSARRIFCEREKVEKFNLSCVRKSILSEPTIGSFAVTMKRAEKCLREKHSQGVFRFPQLNNNRNRRNCVYKLSIESPGHADGKVFSGHRRRLFSQRPEFFSPMTNSHWGFITRNSFFLLLSRSTVFLFTIGRRCFLGAPNIQTNAEAKMFLMFRRRCCVLKRP